MNKNRKWQEFKERRARLVDLYFKAKKNNYVK